MNLKNISTIQNPQNQLPREKNVEKTCQNKSTRRWGFLRSLTTIKSARKGDYSGQALRGVERRVEVVEIREEQHESRESRSRGDRRGHDPWGCRGGVHLPGGRSVEAEE